jgi:hypothetical protein
MKGFRLFVLAGMLAAAGAGVWVAITWGPAARPVVAWLMLLVGLAHLTPLMYRTADGRRLPASTGARWLGGAFICQGLAQLVPEGPAFWVLMTAGLLLLAPAFYHFRKPRQAMAR